MENHFNLVCRLCSAKTNIISLFKGKHRRNRYYIRQLVADIVGIEYEENDYFDCICFTCIIQIYNIYVFKMKSIKNEEELRKLFPESINKQVPPKKQPEIKLPNYQEIKNCITKWLISKKIYVENESSEFEGNSHGDQESTKSFTSTISPVLMDECSQTDEPKSFSTQINCKPPLNHNGSQTDLVKREDACTQCELLKSKNETENSSKKMKLKNEYTQCELLKSTIDSEKTKSIKNVLTQYNIKSTSLDKLDGFFRPNFETDKKSLQTKEFSSGNKNKEFDFILDKLSNNKAKDVINITGKCKTARNYLKRQKITPKDIGQMFSIQNDKDMLDVKSTLQTLNSNIKKNTKKGNSDKLKKHELKKIFSKKAIKINESLLHEKKSNQNLQDLKTLPETGAEGFIQNKEISTINKDTLELKSNASMNREYRDILKPKELKCQLYKKTLHRKHIPQNEEDVQTNQVESSSDKHIQYVEQIQRSYLHTKFNSGEELKNIQKVTETTDLMNINQIKECNKEQESKRYKDIISKSLTIINSPSCVVEPKQSMCPSTSASSGLHTVKGKIEYLRSCHECDAIIHTKREMIKHRKTHMNCFLCKKKFRSIRKTKEHTKAECIRNYFKNDIRVLIAKLDDCRDMKNKYPHIFKEIIDKCSQKRRIGCLVNEDDQSVVTGVKLKRLN